MSIRPPVEPVLVIECGTDWTATGTYAPAGGTPVRLDSPRLEIRSGPDSTFPILLTLAATAGGDGTIAQPTPGTLLFALPAKATANRPTTTGAFEIWATIAGTVTRLAKGKAVLDANVGKR